MYQHPKRLNGPPHNLAQRGNEYPPMRTDFVEQQPFCVNCRQYFPNNFYFSQHMDYCCHGMNYPRQPPLPYNPANARVSPPYNRSMPPPPPPYRRGRQTVDTVNAEVSLYFSGCVKPYSLVGGCGWWVSTEANVICYGSAPVQQNFPSLIRLEYEGLLNGLQAALKRGIRNLTIHCTSDIIVSTFTRGEQSQPYFSSMLHQVKDLHVAIVKALQMFHSTRFFSMTGEANSHSMKLAEKGISDHYQQIDLAYSRKVKALETAPSVPVPTASSTVASSSNSSVSADTTTPSHFSTPSLSRNASTNSPPASSLAINTSSVSPLSSPLTSPILNSNAIRTQPSPQETDSDDSSPFDALVSSRPFSRPTSVVSSNSRSPSPTPSESHTQTTSPSSTNSSGVDCLPFDLFKAIRGDFSGDIACDLSPTFDELDMAIKTHLSSPMTPATSPRKSTLFFDLADSPLVSNSRLSTDISFFTCSQ